MLVVLTWKHRRMLPRPAAPITACSPKLAASDSDLQSRAVGTDPCSDLESLAQRRPYTEAAVRLAVQRRI